MFIQYKIIVNILNNQIIIYACKEFDIKCEICNEWHLQITGIHVYARILNNDCTI